jgi:hypothetical protein
MKKFFIYPIVIIFGIFFIFGMYVWFLNKQARVLVGTARPDFPYRDYSLEELKKIFPHDYENNAPTIQSPEETHQKFLSALKEENFDEAVNCCFREGDRSKIKKFLIDVKQRGQLSLMISDLTEIKKDIVGNINAVYIYNGTYKGEKIGNTIDFIKTSKGYWYIKSF